DRVELLGEDEAALGVAQHDRRPPQPRVARLEPVALAPGRDRDRFARGLAATVEEQQAGAGPPLGAVTREADERAPRPALVARQCDLLPRQGRARRRRARAARLAWRRGRRLAGRTLRERARTDAERDAEVPERAARRQSLSD